MTREEVLKAIERTGPARVPVYYCNGDRSKSDLHDFAVQWHFSGSDGKASEWGFHWETMDGTMGQPVGPVIADWSQAFTLEKPPINPEQRFAWAAGFLEEHRNDFTMANLSLSGFTTMTFIAGFEETLSAFYEEEEAVTALADTVFGFEEDLIRASGELGFDSVHFVDDWGTQDDLIISPELWRSFFKERYRRQFDLCREYGMKVFFHCCGNIRRIIPDFIELGVDVLNLSQPNLFDIEQLGRDYGGKITFMCPVSYQTTSLSGSREEIFADVARLVENLGCYNGGLLGYVEEYQSLGMSDNNYRSCVEAFRELGNYRRRSLV